MMSEPTLINPSLNLFTLRGKSKGLCYCCAAECRQLHDEIVGYELGLDADSVRFMSNTSVALAAALDGILAEGLGARSVGPVLRHCGTCQKIIRTISVAGKGGWDGFHAHVVPVDVSVDNSLHRGAFAVVDGAQLHGTALTGGLAPSAGAVIAPLHNLLALAPGLGVLVLDSIVAQRFPVLARSVASVEGGHLSIDVLERALRRIRGGIAWNRVELLFSLDSVAYMADKEKL